MHQSIHGGKKKTSLSATDLQPSESSNHEAGEKWEGGPIACWLFPKEMPIVSPWVNSSRRGYHVIRKH